MVENSESKLERVLLVDDDKEIVNTMKIAIGMDDRISCEIVEAYDGNEAIEMCERNNPKVVILDMMLPKRSGFLVLEKIKKRTEKDSAPYVIMITGNPGRRHQTYAESLGVCEYLVKPFKMEALTDKIVKYLGK